MTERKWLSREEQERIRPDPVFRFMSRCDLGLWYAWDETQTDAYGPFRTHEEAFEWQKKYAANL